MNDKSHVTMKEAAALTGFPYPAIKSLLEFAHIDIEKQGASWIVDKNDAEAAALALRLAFSHPDDAQDVIDSVKAKDKNVGSFILQDNSIHNAKACPFCNGSDLVIRTKYIENKDMFYSFVQCQDCKASSGSSAAYKDSLICDKEAIRKWNKRP